MPAGRKKRPVQKRKARLQWTEGESPLVAEIARISRATHRGSARRVPTKAASRSPVQTRRTPAQTRRAVSKKVPSLAQTRKVMLEGAEKAIIASVKRAVGEGTKKRTSALRKGDVGGWWAGAWPRIKSALAGILARAFQSGEAVATEAIREATGTVARRGVASRVAKMVPLGKNAMAAAVLKQITSDAMGAIHEQLGA